MMARNSFFYEKDGDNFVLIFESDDGTRDTHFCGPEVAVGFTYDADADRGIQYTTHRHGSPEAVERWASSNRLALRCSGYFAAAQVQGETAAAVLRSLQPHIITSDQWEIEDLNRILDTTGYLKVALEKMGLDLATEELSVFA